MAECVYRLEMGRGYTIDQIEPLDPHWWGFSDAGRFALMAIEDDLLDGEDLRRLWGTEDLGAVRSAIEERAERLATAKGRGEARGLRVVSHTRNILHTRHAGSNTQDQDFSETAPRQRSTVP